MKKANNLYEFSSQIMNLSKNKTSQLSNTADTDSQHLYPPRPTWLEIDLSAIAYNTGQVRQIIGPDCLLMSVVKANAYGHGAIQTSKAALQAGADRLAVASLSEALELRNNNIQAPILVLGYTPSYQAAEAVDADITLTVFDHELAQALDDAAIRANKPISIHIKINTGMNRLGLLPKNAPQFIKEIERLRQVHVEGIFTHFATADQLDQTFMFAQFKKFETLLEELDRAGIRPPIAHAANSAAMLTLPASHLQMVRTGIATYGLHPDMDEVQLPNGFRPALCWKAMVAQVAHLQTGDSVSYGSEFVVESPTTIAIIPVGYADGFPRKPYHWGHVLIHGQPAPIVGRVCMDQTIVDVTHIKLKNDTTSGRTDKLSSTVHQGDEVILIGSQGEARLSADEIGRRLHTINYDVISRILSRVPRIYV